MIDPDFTISYFPINQNSVSDQQKKYFPWKLLQPYNFIIKKLKKKNDFTFAAFCFESRLLHFYKSKRFHEVHD